MAEILLTIYLAAGSVIAIIVFFFTGARFVTKKDSQLESQIANYIHRKRTNTLFGRLRFHFQRILSCLSLIVAWPVVLYSIRLRKLTGRQREAKIRLTGYYIEASLLTVALSTILVLSRSQSHATWIIDVGCYLVLLSFAGRLAFFSIQGTDLPKMLRTTLLPPYLHFILVGIVDFASLLLVARTLQWTEGDSLTPSILSDQARDLVALGHFSHVFKEVPSTIDALMITLGALTFAISFASQITRPKRFKRKPADHASIILNLIILGRISMARQRLDKLESEEIRDASMLTARAALMIAEGNYDRGYDVITADFASKFDTESLTYSSRTPDDISSQLIVLALVTTTIEFNQAQSLVSCIARRGISDGCLCLCLMRMREFNVFRSDKELSIGGIHPEEYPLTYAVSHAFNNWIDDDDIDDVDDMVASFTAVELSNAFDRVVQDGLAVSFQWLDGSIEFDVLDRFLLRIDQGVDFPGWLSIFCGTTLTRIARTKFDDGQSELQKRVESLRSRLLTSASQSEEMEFDEAAKNTPKGWVGTVTIMTNS